MTVISATAARCPLPATTGMLTLPAATPFTVMVIPPVSYTHLDVYKRQVILTMKVRHLKPRQMVSVPEQRVTVRHPVLKAPPGEMCIRDRIISGGDTNQITGSCRCAAS